MVFFAGVLTLIGFTDDGLYRTTWGRVLGTAISLAITAAGIAAVVIVRRRRARWMREYAVYESYEAFAAYAKERKGLILQLGRMFVLSAATRGLLLPQLLGSTRQMTIRDCYLRLQDARRSGAIGDVELRDAIDELLEEAANRNYLY